MSAPTIRTAWRRARRPGPALALAAAACVLLLLVVVFVARERARERARLPLLSGAVALAGIGEPVEIHRDAAAVPHVFARSSRDAWRALGFVHAQDRLAQLLWLRALARGRAAEWRGDGALASDRFARTVGLGSLADATFAALPAATREVLESYAAGVTAGIARVRDGEAGLPAALAELGVRPESLEDWAPEDSVAVFKLLCWGAGPSIEAPAVLDSLTQRLGGVGARPFEPQGESLRAVTIPFSPPPAVPTPAPLVPGTGGDPTPPPADALVPRLFDGSAWLIAGAHTESGKPLLAADWQVAPTTPALLHQAHIEAPDLRIAGAFVPGLPVVWLGRNAALAWAVLPARAVTTGFFEETIRERAAGTLYHDGFVWRAAGERDEQIRVRASGGTLADVAVRIRSTRHGPLVHELFSGDHAPLSVAWTGAVAGDGLTSLLGLATARDGAAVRGALRTHHEPVVSVVYVDASGAGGMQVAGWLPRRVLPTSMQPVPARLRTYDWSAPIPFDELPSRTLASDERGWLAVADARLVAAERGASDAEWLWRTGARDARLERLLGRLVARGRVGVRDLAKAQVDTFSTSGPALVRALDALLAESRLAPEEAEMLAILRAWDGDLAPTSRGAAVHGVLVEELTASLFRDAMTPALFERYAALPHSRIRGVMRGVVSAAARDGEADGASRAAGWSEPARVRSLARVALSRTWARLASELGPNREHWAWGRLERAAFEPFVTGTSRALAAPRALGGGEGTVVGVAHDEHFQVVRAATYRLVVDLAIDDEMLSSLAPGQLEAEPPSAQSAAIDGWIAGRAGVLRTAPGLGDAVEGRVLTLEPSE